MMSVSPAWLSMQILPLSLPTTTLESDAMVSTPPSRVRSHALNPPPLSPLTVELRRA